MPHTTDRNPYAGKRVTVMGLGLHGGGLATAQWFLGHGAEVTVTDMKTRAELRPSVVALERAARNASGSLAFVLGRHRPQDFRTADLVVQNPGVPRESPYLAIARRNRVPIANEASIFFSMARAFPHPSRIVGVTGTRGKSTTTALIHTMLRAARHRPVFLGGNIRIPMLAILEDVRRASRRGPVDVVLELSSWHCEHLSPRTGGPDVAVVTNLFRDHLNRYRSLRGYAAAKARIVRFQDRASGIAVLNADDPIISGFRALGPRTIRSFTLRAPSGKRWSGIALERGQFVEYADRVRRRIAARRDLRLLGTHNSANAAAAIAAARALGVPVEAIRAGLRTFSGLPGRLEVVRRAAGVTYVNDTTATSPDGTRAALAALRAEGFPIVLIAGGTDKNLTFGDWAADVLRDARVIVFLPGSATEKMERELRDRAHGTAPTVTHARSMAAAVRAARRSAKRGDAIVLSPGAASFGLFTHEFDRGAQFVRWAMRN